MIRLPEEREPYLKVYSNRSILVSDSEEIEFLEGSPSQAAIERLKKVREALQDEYLIKLIENVKTPGAKRINLNDDQKRILSNLVNFTSEKGRALVGLTIMQLCIKSIVPEQSIRLHKAGRSGDSDFSWVEGIPMRALDKNFITPTLRKYNLLKLNADGFMMTRSLAENYPYSSLYKAAIRGAKAQWIQIVELLENGELPALDSLKYLLMLLSNRSDKFIELTESTLEKASLYVQTNPSLKDVSEFILDFVKHSSYSARVFEVALHSLIQVIDELGILEGQLKPLTQMRSANKKHGNLGDVEIVSPLNSYSIFESWDAKYGKPYLRDELDELEEKLEIHHETKLAGFVVDTNPDVKQEIVEKLKELNEFLSTRVSIFSFYEWVEFQVKRTSGYISENELGEQWLIVFAECLSQKRREKAPIDEPCDEWIRELDAALSNKI